MTESVRPTGRRFTPPFAALLLFSSALAIFGVGGWVVASKGLGLWVVAPLQGLALLLPAVLWAIWSGAGRSALSLGLWSPKTLTPAVLLIAGASAVALSMAGLFFGLLGEREGERFLRGALEVYPLPLRLLLFAAVPALCEEIFFRGAILNALEPLGRNRACWATGLLFALLHLDPLKMMPVAVLGIALAYVVWECGSLWPAIVGHALHNGVVLVFAEAPVGENEIGGAFWWTLALVAGGGIAGIWAGSRLFPRSGS